MSQTDRPFGIGDLVQHRHGGIYRVVDRVTIERNLTPAYVYRDIKTGMAWVRPLSEMLDGRFTKIDDVQGVPVAPLPIDDTLDHQDAPNGRSGALSRQVDGDHYQGAGIQPWDIWEAYNLDPWEANALKYLLRRKKGVARLTDLRKLAHYVERCIERELERKV